MTQISQFQSHAIPSNDHAVSHDATPANGDTYRGLASLGETAMPPLLNPSEHPASSETRVRARRDTAAPVIALHDGLNVVAGGANTVDAGGVTSPYATLRLAGGETRMINPREMIIDMGAGATKDTVNVGRSGNDLVVDVTGAKQKLVVPGLYGMTPQPILTLTAGGLKYYVDEGDTIAKLGKALGNPNYQPSDEVREFLKSKWHG